MRHKTEKIKTTDERMNTYCKNAHRKSHDNHCALMSIENMNAEISFYKAQSLQIETLMYNKYQMELTITICGRKYAITVITSPFTSPTTTCKKQ